MAPIARYFDAERLENLFFVGVGAIALGAAAYALLGSQHALLRGAAWPPALLALIQAGPMLGLDALGERRGAIYLDWLRTLPLA